MSASRFADEAQARAVLGPRAREFLTAIFGCELGTYHEELLCTAVVIIPE